MKAQKLEKKLEQLTIIAMLSGVVIGIILIIFIIVIRFTLQDDIGPFAYGLIMAVVGGGIAKIVVALPPYRVLSKHLKAFDTSKEGI